VALLSARRALIAKPAPRRMGTVLFCAVVGGMIFMLLAMAAWASFVTLAYNLALTFKNYAFSDFDTNGWDAYWNSVVMASWTAVIGTVVVFLGAYLLERRAASSGGAASLNSWPCCRWRCRAGDRARLHLLLQRQERPLASSTHDDHPVVNSVTHFYTVSHLTAHRAEAARPGSSRRSRPRSRCHCCAPWRG
jgi:iron(III) transport system permease protein